MVSSKMRNSSKNEVNAGAGLKKTTKMILKTAMLRARSILPDKQRITNDALVLPGYKLIDTNLAIGKGLSNNS